MEWLKIKGYYHFSSQVSNDWRRQKLLIQHVQNKNYIAKYAFFPLLHTNIKERRYKKHPSKLNKKGKAIRVHSYYDEDKKKFVKTTKIRPLHYANHKDAVIYSYYAFILNKYYENYLKTFPQLNASITAYRKIPVLNSTLADEKIKNKGSLHFAAEVFKEIKERAKYKDKVAVIALDIKSFFSSLDHVYLKKLWEYILGVPNLPSDHFNVFKSVTNFSFVYKNDLRKFKTRKGRKANFNEKKIAEIRNKKGINAFFKNPKDFREAIKNKEIFVYKNNFKNKKGEMIGIPQGLPISAVLANLYLLEFDKVIVNELVKKHNCFYRRYSDDIILIGEEMDLNKIEDFVIKEMKKVKVEISKEKTEKFIFKKANGRLTSFKNGKNDEWIINQPLTYLGIEFYGYQTLIKSANLSKFYRRMIYAIKSKAKIAIKQAEKDNSKPVIFKNQITNLYRDKDLSKKKILQHYKIIRQMETGEFRTILKKKIRNHQGNYFSYVKRAADILEAPEILEQIRNEKKIFNQAVQKHFKNKT